MATKRNTGLPKITKRADGRYWTRIEVGYVHGKRQRKAVYGKTAKEVAEKAASLLHHRTSGIAFAPERTTLEQFIARWLDEEVAQRVRPLSLENYRKLCKNYIVPHIGRVPVAKLTPQHIHQVIRAGQRHGLSATTIRLVHGVLRSALHTAEQWELVPRNVATLVSPPRAERYTAQVLSADQAQQFLRALQGHRMDAVFRVALGLGMRQGELLGVRWQDVDLDRGTLTVRVSLQTVGGRFVLAPPKTARSTRTLPLSPSLVAVLRGHRARQLAQRVKIGPTWQDWNLVFASEVGTPLDPRTVRDALRATLTRAHLPPMRFHDLRHSCATFLALQGVPARVAMEILGHATIHTTLQIYTQVIGDATAHAVAQLDALLDVREVG